ncbi:MAG: hypothetical protein ABIN79_01575 [Marmoricola sp.]
MPQQQRSTVFWSRVLRPGAGGSWHHLVGDEEFGTFLSRRLREERAAAEQRRLAGSVPATPLRALELLDELVDDLDRGILPDETSLQILTTVYCTHPDFRDSWLPATMHATL